MHIIAGQFRHRRLIVPKGSLTKPTTSSLRGAVFNICQNRIEGCRFLDLYAGSGAMGFEALSRNAQSAIFVDRSREAIRCIVQNAGQLGVQNKIEIFSSSVSTALNLLKNQKQVFDIIYADPPYRQTDASELIRFLDGSPLLISGGFLFIEEAIDAAPKLNDLTSLHLKSSRRYGSTILQQYQA